MAYLWNYDYWAIPDVTCPPNLTGLSTAMLTEMNANAITIQNASGQKLTNEEFIQEYVLNSNMYPFSMLQYMFNSNLTPKDFAVPGSELDQLLGDISQKGYLTLGGGQTAYFPPTVHDMSMKISLTLFAGSNLNDVKSTIKSLVYAYLKANTNFD